MLKVIKTGRNLYAFAGIEDETLTLTQLCAVLASLFQIPPCQFMLMLDEMDADPSATSAVFSNEGREFLYCE